MNPEQGIALEGIEVVVQVDVVLITQISGAFAPGGIHLVDGFPFQLHRYCHEVAVGVDQGADPSRFEIFELVLHQMKDHVRAGLVFLGGSEAEVWGAITAPAHGLSLGPG